MFSKFITPAAVANSHHAFTTLKGANDHPLMLRAAAGEVVCLLDNQQLTVTQLVDDLLFRRTSRTMIAEVFEYEYACRAIEAANRLPDLEREALLLYSGVNPDELGQYASEAAESRAEARYALYGY